jgi:arylsulfatase A-like enzyme
VFIAIVALALLTTGASTRAAGSTPPNILVIVSDDQRWGTVDGWMPKTTQWFHTGGTGVSGGTEFENAFATNPLCCPSRASIFTGRYSHNHKVFVRGDFTTVAPGGPNFSVYHSTTLQHYLRTRPANPYITGMIGKLLNFWPLADAPPDFDRWTIWDNGFHYATTTTPQCSSGLIGLNCVNRDGTLTTAPLNTYETDYVYQRAEDFVNYADARNDSQPWLLFLDPTVPHVPSQPQDDASHDYTSVPVPAPVLNAGQHFPTTTMSGKPEYVRDTKDRAYNTGVFADDPPYVCTESDVPANTPAPDAYKDCVLSRRQSQYRMLLSLDDMVDKVMTMLQAHGEEQDTLAIFISDNGMQWGEFWLEGKPHPYSDGARVDMLMRWPANSQRVPQNFTDTRLVGNVDIAPTAMDAAGVTSQPSIPFDGRSMLDGGDPGVFRRSQILLERPGRATTLNPANETRERRVNHPPTWASLFSAPEALDYSQYTEYYASSDTTVGTPVQTFYELYQLHDDPFEIDNAFGANGWPDTGEPDATARSAALANARNCAGANGELLPSRPACP